MTVSVNAREKVRNAAKDGGRYELTKELAFTDRFTDSAQNEIWVQYSRNYRTVIAVSGKSWTTGSHSYNKREYAENILRGAR